MPKEELRLNVWYYALLSGGIEETYEKPFRIDVLQDDIRTHDLANTNET